jgi:hypothetical protein
MIDLDAKVRKLVEDGASRADIIRELDSIANGTDVRATRLFEPGKRDQRFGERALVIRIERILFYCRNNSPADHATDADCLLYDLLKKTE